MNFVFTGFCPIFLSSASVSSFIQTRKKTACLTLLERDCRSRDETRRDEMFVILQRQLVVFFLPPIVKSWDEAGLYPFCHSLSLKGRFFHYFYVCSRSVVHHLQLVQTVMKSFFLLPQFVRLMSYGSAQLRTAEFKKGGEKGKEEKEKEK